MRNYLVYFEQGRIELLRSGSTYKDLEDQGFLLVVTKVEVRYHRPARYDDVLTIRTTVVRTDDGAHRPPVRGVLRRPAAGRGHVDAGLRGPRRPPQALPEFLQDR